MNKDPEAGYSMIQPQAASYSERSVENLSDNQVFIKLVK